MEKDLKIYVVAYSGKSLISKMIKLWTISNKSHVSILFSDGYEFEAWHKSDRTRWYRPLAGCFQKVKFGTNHKKGTPVIVYEIVNISQTKIKTIRTLVEDWAEKRIPYDYAGTTRFLTKINRGDDKKLFCSESVMEAFNFVRFYILKRVASYLVNPAMITYSPRIGTFMSGKIGDNFSKIFGTK